MGIPAGETKHGDDLVQAVVSTDNPLFDTAKMGRCAGARGGETGCAAPDAPPPPHVPPNSSVEHANAVTSTFGVEILSINIISASPIDSTLTRALASGAVASAEALMAETTARGE